jgi:predicted secreted Zn-dependent protease
MLTTIFAICVQNVLNLVEFLGFKGPKIGLFHVICVPFAGLFCMVMLQNIEASCNEIITDIRDTR